MDVAVSLRTYPCEITDAAAGLGTYPDETMGVTASLGTYPKELRILPEWQYSVVSETLYQPELGEYHTYGIQVMTPVHTDILHDVSTTKQTVAHIVELLNQYQASPVHLHDIVADMLP